ncbi:MAG: glycosyltransferase [Clostridia bacterium]|nr:glycosyltransferase [Clostridia bacterium]
MLLSVIVPFYNVGAYFEECLAPLCALDAGECEILLVDDCGQDDSLPIAQAFAGSMETFRLIRREKNGGLSAARNTGLDAAQGEYVYFLDSDDIPDAQAILALTRRAKFLALDVAKGKYVCFDDETGVVTPGAATKQSAVTDGGTLFAAQCREGVYEPMVWQCVYRRAFLEENGLRMAEGLLYEDELFQAPALLKAEKAACYNEVLLRYRQREGSIMKSFARNSRWCASYLEVCRRLSVLAAELPAGEAKKALKKRVGQIALSVVKNVPGYHLPEDVAREVLAFARENLAELSGYAIKSGDALVGAQGVLMRASITAFVKLYSRV